MGITKRTDWAQPFLDLRTAYQKVNGTPMSYAFPRLYRSWALVAEGSSPFSATRRKQSLLCVGLGALKAESYTLQSPQNLFHTAAIQMSFDQKELDLSYPDGKITLFWLVSVGGLNFVAVNITGLTCSTALLA